MILLLHVRKLVIVCNLVTAESTFFAFKYRVHCLALSNQSVQTFLMLDCLMISLMYFYLSSLLHISLMLMFANALEYIVMDKELYTYSFLHGWNPFYEISEL